MKTPLTSSQQVALDGLKIIGAIVVIVILVMLCGCATSTLNPDFNQDCIVPPEKWGNFEYTYICPDTGSMRPAINDGDTLKVQPPAIQPWHYDMGLLGKIVIRINVPNHPAGLCHRIIAITSRGAVTGGDNNVDDRGIHIPDPGFMAIDGSDYGGMVTVVKHVEGPQKLHSFQRL